MVGTQSSLGSNVPSLSLCLCLTLQIPLLWSWLLLLVIGLQWLFLNILYLYFLKSYCYLKLYMEECLPKAWQSFKLPSHGILGCRKTFMSWVLVWSLAILVTNLNLITYYLVPPCVWFLVMEWVASPIVYPKMVYWLDTTRPRAMEPTDY